MAGPDHPIPPSATGAWGHTSIVALWVPVVVFAHVFAAFWLLKTVMLNVPSLRRKARRSAGKSVKHVSSVRAAGGKVQLTAGGAAAARAGDQVSIQVGVLHKRGGCVGGWAAAGCSSFHRNQPVTFA